MNKTTITYKNKKVYIGMDVHKKPYTLSAYCQGQVVKTATTPADPERITQSLKKWFPLAHLYSVYEAGFSGYRLHRALCHGGIKNIVVNSASLEIAIKDRVKTDRRDSRKLGEQLSMGRLKGIYIPEEQEELRRQVTRTRRQVVKQIQRLCNQIKGKLIGRVRACFCKKTLYEINWEEE
ncbi:MAG: transposase [Bdellovibrionales bacterium]|nr:transposase [Bdellovibrionales bacterium]